jgi:O-antigen/teichoic acid export membrane protein
VSDLAPTAAVSSADETAAGSDVARALRSSFRLGGALVATWGVSLAVRVILPRSLGPAGFGVYNFADAFSTTCFVVLTLGLDPYIHKEIPLRIAHATDFVAGVVTLRLTGAALVTLVMWGILVISHRSVEVQEVVLLFAAVQAFSLNNDSLAALLHAANRIDGLAVANVVTKVVWGLLLIGLALTRSGLVALAVATLGVEVLRTGWFWVLAQQGLGLRWRIDLSGVRTVLLASMPFFVNTVAHTAYGKVDATMLAFLSSDVEVGYYGVALSLGGLTLILTPLIGWVWFPLTARAAARSRRELVVLVQNSLRVILSIAIPLALAIWLGAADLVHLAFGAPFQPATGTLHVLAPLFVVTYAAIMASSYLARIDRVWTATVISLGGLVLTPLLTLVLVHPASIAFGAGGASSGAALALLITEISVLTAMLVSLRGEIVGRETLRSVAAGVACAAAVVVVDRLLAPRLGVWRYPLDGLAYLGLAVASGGIRLGELRQVVADGLRLRRQS